ncbi:MAG: hypothetical protein R2568_11540 [Candidatus Scalindua sp.]|jgi:catalase-peroxidase|nr:hypothetical protein [Candidatus Scalindua sp.]MDV5167359.1 hypothetical protein [Candidatus Scalindua sp.]
MKKRNLLITTAITGLMVFSLLTSAMANPDLSKGEAKSNQFWWPEQIDLSPLRQHDAKSNPFGESFNYAEEFNKLDLEALKKDIDTSLTTSQD